MLTYVHKEMAQPQQRLFFQCRLFSFFVKGDAIIELLWPLLVLCQDIIMDTPNFIV